MSLPHLTGEREVGVCPLCDGPCQGHLPDGSPAPSPYRFPDRLVHLDAEGVEHDPADPPEPKPKPRKRGKRRKGKAAPDEDRARRRDEDR